MSFNKELFNTVMREFAVPQTLKSAILGEGDLPEDFDESSAMSAYLTEREGFYKDRFRDEIVEDYKNGEGKDQYIATIKPLRNRIIKSFGLTEDEVKGVKDIKALIDLAQTKTDKRIQEQGSKSTAALQSELTEVRTKFADLHEEHTNLKENTEARINTIEAEKESTIHHFKVNSDFLRRLKSEKFKWSQPLANVETLLKVEMDKRDYKSDYTPDGKDIMIYAKDGTKAFTIDGKDQYKDFDSAIIDLGSHLELFKKSNGGEGGEPILIDGERQVGGKKIDNANINFLKESMGVQ